MARRTLFRPAELSGVGLHTGRFSRLHLLPASKKGLYFTFGDESFSLAQARGESSGRGTDLHFPGGRVLRTAEHLMAALFGMALDDLEIAVEGEEVPAADGSALPFVEAIESAGIVESDEPSEAFAIPFPIGVDDPLKGRSICALPGAALFLTYVISFSHPSVGVQYLSCEVDPERFRREIAPARTFAFLDEVESLRRSGLARGGSLENAVVIGDDGVLNRDGLRFPDEFVRHKLLDLLGDLAILGCRLAGHVVACRTGHDLHLALADRIDRIRPRGDKT
ncbi:MAG TPA: UDP-3-O-acyl-N-acetylglucosamine deacetylase [Thermosynergistes sp.]|nr:UDP-3-O-acyl-N-acetylglucosamine deacetylase [Thermosynergistes sp.]